MTVSSSIPMRWSILRRRIDPIEFSQGGEGVTGYIILGAVAALLGALLFTPIRVRASYEAGDTSVILRVLFFTATLYPRPVKEGAETGAKEPKEKKEKTPGSRKKFSLNADQILYSLEKLPPILGRALKGFGTRLRIAPLKVHLLIAGPDPADTAVLYGRILAALESAMPVLHRVMHISDQDIRLFPDFSADSMDCIADVGISIRLWDVLVIGLRAGVSLVGWFLGFRKLADKPTEKTTAPSGAGAA